MLVFYLDFLKILFKKKTTNIPWLDKRGNIVASSQLPLIFKVIMGNYFLETEVSTEFTFSFTSVTSRKKKLQVNLSNSELYVFCHVDRKKV